MADNRTVVVDGQDAGFGDLMDQMKRLGEDMYKSLDDGATDHTKSLDDQHRKITELIHKQREKLSILKEEQRVVAQMQLAERLENAKSEGDANRAKEQHKSSVKEINDFHQRQGAMGGGADARRGDQKVGMRQRFQDRRRRVGGRVGSVAAGMGGGALVGGLFSIIGNMFQEGAALEESSIALRNITGESAGTPGLGLKTSEAQQYYRRLARGRGVTGMDEIGGQLKVERQTGMDLGSLGFLGQFARQGGGDVAGLTQRVLGMAEKSGIWNIDKGDFSALSEKMEHIGSLMGEEKKYREDGITGSRAAAMLGQFASMGGGFADDRALGRIESISGGIRNPANEFVKALMMTGISRGADARGEELDLFGIRQRMEQGAAGENVLSDVLGMFQKQFGKGSRMLQTALGTAFPQLMGNQGALEILSNFDAGKLTEERYNEIIAGSPEMDLSGRATTGVVQSNRARIGDVMAKTGIKMIDALSGVMETLISGFEKLPKVIDALLSMASNIKNFLQDPAQVVDENLTTPIQNALGLVSYEGDPFGLAGGLTGRSIKGGGAGIIQDQPGQGIYRSVNIRGGGAGQDWIQSLTAEEQKALFAYGMQIGTANKEGNIFQMQGGTAKQFIKAFRGEDIELAGQGGLRSTDERVINALGLLVDALTKNTESRGGTGITEAGKYGKKQ